MNKSIKKVLGLLVLTMILIIPFNVEAKNYKATLSFFSQGGIENSGNIEVYNNIVFEKDGTKADVTYKSTDTINNINSLDKKTTFTLKKNNKAQAKNKEWYGRKYTDDTKVYFSNAEKYKVSDIIKKLAIDTSIYSEDESIEVFLYANYSNTTTSSTDKTTKTDNKTVAVKSIKLNTSSKTIKIGETTTLKATISPSDATNKEVTWKSSDTKIATVDSNGKVKGIKEGSVTITATTKDGKKTAKETIKVEKSKVNQVIIKFNVNGGKLAEEHKKTITVKQGLIRENGNEEIQAIAYNESTNSNGLVNYANKNFINIEKDGFVAYRGAEWNTKPDGTGKSYSHSQEYKASDFCDASKKDCTVTLYVNWKSRNYIYFLETETEGNTDSILLVSGNKYGLIDTSETWIDKENGIRSSSGIMAQLEKIGVKELEFLQYTHAHSDHVGNFANYLNKNSPIKVKKLYIKADGAKTDGLYQNKYKNIIEKAKNNNIEICDVKKSKCNDFYLGAIHLQLYNTNFHKVENIKQRPTKKADETDDEDERDYQDAYENLNSIVTLATIYNRKIYLTGDIGNYDIVKTNGNSLSSDKQETIVAKKVGEVDVYKVAHHGNSKYNGYPDIKNGKSPTIKNILKPKYAIFTANKDGDSKREKNRQKKRKKIEEELDSIGSKKLYTGEGTIRVSVNSSGNLKVTQKEKSWWK